VSDSISVHHQESSTIHRAIGIGHTGYANCLLASSQHNLYDLDLFFYYDKHAPLLGVILHADIT